MDCETYSGFITSKIFSIEVYETTKNYCKDDENVQLQVTDEPGNQLMEKNGNDFFFKQTSMIGRGEDHEFKLMDPYVSYIHSKLDWSDWFRANRLWVKQYTEIVKIPGVPIVICRYIFDFIREPRCVKLVDIMSSNGTMVALKPSEPVKLVNKQQFRLGESLILTVKKQETYEKKKEDFMDVIDKKIVEFLPPNSQSTPYTACTDYLKAEEGDSKSYNFLSLKVSLAGRENVNCRYVLVSNKKEARWVVGSSVEADVHIKHEKIDEFQCEIVLKDGVWTIVEWQHQNKKKKTWVKLGKNQKEYRITQDTEFLTGKTYFSLRFPGSEQTKKSVYKGTEDYETADSESEQTANEC